MPSLALNKFKIALIGGISRTEIDAINRAAVQELDPHVVVKPQRMFGAVWTSDKVAQRLPVVMCESCWRRYKGWWKQAKYKADWGWRYLGDCDGCSIRNIHVTFFNAEEKFYTGLANNHGIYPQP
jgi:hypothetical protein